MFLQHRKSCNFYLSNDRGIPRAVSLQHASTPPRAITRSCTRTPRLFGFVEMIFLRAQPRPEINVLSKVGGQLFKILLHLPRPHLFIIFSEDIARKIALIFKWARAVVFMQIVPFSPTLVLRINDIHLPWNDKRKLLSSVSPCLVLFIA